MTIKFFASYNMLTGILIHRIFIEMITVKLIYSAYLNIPSSFRDCKRDMREISNNNPIISPLSNHQKVQYHQ
jgi:hypothetical protein